MPKDREEVVKLIDALEDAGLAPLSYSGRGMFGKDCVATYTGMWEVAKALFSEEHDGAFDHLPQPNQDSMGLGRVLYWPSYEWPKDRNSGPTKRKTIRKTAMTKINHVIHIVPVSVSFRGPRQHSAYRVANEAAVRAGWENAKFYDRHQWNLDDFDVAAAEFHRVLDNLTLGMEQEREA